MKAIFRGWQRGGDDQVALVLAIVIVGDDNDLATGESLDGFPNARLRHVLYSPNPFSARNLGLPSRSFNVVSRHSSPEKQSLYIPECIENLACLHPLNLRQSRMTELQPKTLKQLRRFYQR